ncbi:hypothetical protein GCM10012275_29310 [Longimycelium tulufanense]|uniref:HTH luxR-type domain-containing protein n=1 Tax=Longimycelium tulufanense TaxID=907463 RepID=A0A8J3CEP6_9PSEU|nr:hypothetical protein GCM10012275_29310 [Longimycelium tulufanense]
MLLETSTRRLHHSTDLVEVLDPTLVARRISQLAATATMMRSTVGGGDEQQDRDQTALPEITPGKVSHVLIDPIAARCFALRSRFADAAPGMVRVRVHPDPLHRIILFDDRYAVVPLAGVGLGGGGLLLRHPLTTPWLHLFTQLWANSRRFPPTFHENSGLTAREQQVASLLVRGATDHQVASRLGVSARTVRTVVSGLQQRYGTNSRMALGFRLAGCGVLSPDGTPAGTAGP